MITLGSLHCSGAYMLHHEAHPCPPDLQCTEASMVRKEYIKRTVYELKFPAHAIGVDACTSGFSFGVGTCINDGDTADGQGGQGGWSGWSPYGIVFGKESENNGLATLVGRLIAPTLATWVPTGDTVVCEDIRGNQGGMGLAAPQTHREPMTPPRSNSCAGTLLRATSSWTVTSPTETAIPVPNCLPPLR